MKFSCGARFSESYSPIDVQRVYTAAQKREAVFYVRTVGESACELFFSSSKVLPYLFAS